MYFKLNDKIGSILDSYPETLEVFVANGFEQLQNSHMRKAMANSVTLEMALRIKNIDEDIFVEKLNSAIEKNKVDRTLFEEGSFADGDIKIEGVLPCPIRIPLLENFSAKIEKLQKDTEKKIGYDLRSASMGLDWIKKQFLSADENEISDIILSAGFELFFDEKYIGKFSEKGIFNTGSREFNKDFSSSKIDLKDPIGEYHIIGVVPAIFMVNKKMLGDRKMPSSWEDILKPEFENSLAMPMRDLDLFSAIILHIYKRFGDDGVKNLARSFCKSMHPAQMLKDTKSVSTPVVNISPYFFTQMVPEGGDMEVVWPSDGAIISPIFLIAKKDKEDLNAFLNYFMSKEVGEIFASGGKFPSTNPEVDNHLKESQNFQWIGWDFIRENNIGELLRHCEDIFNSVVVG